MRILLISGLLICNFFLANADTTSIYFRLDVPHLEAKAIGTIDSLIYHDIINQQQELLIIGYADHLGTDGYNDTLSMQRAANVNDYLVGMGIPTDNITLCTGKGEVYRDVELPAGYAVDRRVDIVLIQKSATPVKRRPTEKTLQLTTPAEQSGTRKAFARFTPEEVQVGQLFVLDKIFFHTGRHKVIDASLPELDKLYDILADNPTLEINIEGHVCCVPPYVDALDMDTGEQALSVNRAKFIYEYLIEQGIERNRLSYEGFGKKRPLRMPEYKQEDQDLNKRVEIRILKK